MLVGIGALVGMLRVPGSRSSLVPFEFGLGVLGMRGSGERKVRGWGGAELGDLEQIEQIKDQAPAIMDAIKAEAVRRNLGEPVTKPEGA